MGEATPFRDAEAWLARQGVRREPLRVEPAAPAAPTESHEPAAAAAPAPPAPPADREGADGDEGDRGGANLEDEVRRAVATAQRLTAAAPHSEARLRAKLAERSLPEVVLDLALERCRRLGIVDDPALAAALTDEGRRKGHAPARIRQDLERRGLASAAVDAALADVEYEDQEVAAFAVAQRRAASLAGLDGETAFRRLVGQLARRGYPEALCRKVARDVLWTDREPRRASER